MNSGASGVGVGEVPSGEEEEGEGEVPRVEAARRSFAMAAERGVVLFSGSGEEEVVVGCGEEGERRRGLGEERFGEDILLVLG